MEARDRIRVVAGRRLRIHSAKPKALGTEESSQMFVMPFKMRPWGWSHGPVDKCLLSKHRSWDMCESARHRLWRDRVRHRLPRAP